MKKKILSLLLSLFCLCGAAACSSDVTKQSAPEQRQISECPDGDCPDDNSCPDGNCPKQDDGCPDGNCPKQDDDCPDGDCPKQDNGCPDGDCPGQGEPHTRRPLPHGKPSRRLFPPKLPIRPVQPLPEPTV